jgi:hypothetical protein
MLFYAPSFKACMTKIWREEDVAGLSGLSLIHDVTGWKVPRTKTYAVKPHCFHVMIEAK